MSRDGFTAPARLQRQVAEETAELLEKFAAAPEAAETMASVEVGQTPSEVVYSENKLDLLHYEPRTDEQHDVPVLVVYALINRPYILDLQPDRSVVRRLLDAGLDVYLIQWGEPSTLDTSLSLHDYVNRYIDNCVDVVRERSGADAINVLGYCMGGTMSVMHAALNPEKVRALGLMAAGLCYEGDTSGILGLWGSEEYYDPESVVETFGNVPSEFLDAGFAMLDPVQNTVTKYARLYDNIDDEAFLENFARMERWLADGVDVAGRAYQEYLELLYQQNRLMRNDLRLDGDLVDIENLEMPILQIVADYDHLVPPESSTRFNDVVPSDDVETIRSPTGHIGLSVSSKAHEQAWPDVCAWFVERSATEDGGDSSGTDSAADVEAETDDSAVESGADGSADEAVAAEEADVEAAAERAAGDSPETDESGDIEDVSGIGSEYATRLRAAGIETVGDLADADPETLGEETGISPKRVRRWIDSVESRRE